MPRDSAAADRPASYLVGTAAAFPLFFRDRTKPINQLPFSPSAKFPKSGSSCESRVRFVAEDSTLEEIGFELVVPWRAASRQGPTNCPAILIAAADRNYPQS